MFDTNPLLKLHFASHCIYFFYPFRLFGRESSQLNKMSMCVWSRTMCPHLGGVMTYPWMVLRCNLVAEIKLEHDQSAENE